MEKCKMVQQLPIEKMESAVCIWAKAACVHLILILVGKALVYHSLITNWINSKTVRVRQSREKKTIWN